MTVPLILKKFAVATFNFTNIFSNLPSALKVLQESVQSFHGHDRVSFFQEKSHDEKHLFSLYIPLFRHSNNC